MTVTSKLTARMSWNRQTALDLSTVSDQGFVDFSKSLASGTAIDQNDLTWADSRTITTGANDDLDLSALTQSIYASTVTVAFAKIKAIVIVNLNASTGNELYLDSSVTNGFTAGFNGSATSKVEIGADSILFWSSAKDGWAVDGTHKVLRVHNANAGSVSYKIAIIGTSV